MFTFLSDLGLKLHDDFYEQYPVGNYLLDFAFILSRKPFRGLDIETDGVRFHSSPTQRQKDGYRTYKLMKSGWAIERFGETFTRDDVEQILRKYKILETAEEAGLVR
jgi:very-short-patch-repair endonuclease